MEVTSVLIGQRSEWYEVLANPDTEGGVYVYSDEKGNGVYSPEWLSGIGRIVSAHLWRRELKLGKEKGVRIRDRSGGRMLENKRERLKTFLRKIDEKTIFGIKHLMKER